MNNVKSRLHQGHSRLTENQFVHGRAGMQPGKCLRCRGSTVYNRLEMAHECISCGYTPVSVPDDVIEEYERSKTKPRGYTHTEPKRKRRVA